MFKFLQSIEKKKQEQTQSREKTYAGLLLRAALKDDLSDDESLNLSELHAQFGGGADLEAVAQELREERDLEAREKQLPKLQQSEAKARAAFDTKCAESAKVKAEHERIEAALKAEVSRLDQAHRHARAEIDEAERAAKRRREIRDKYFRVYGLEDPAVVAQREKEAEAERDRVRPLETTADLLWSIQQGFWAGKELASHPLMPADGQPEKEHLAYAEIIRGVIDGSIYHKNIRFIRRASGDYDIPGDKLREDGMTLVFEGVMHTLSITPGRWREYHTLVFAPHPQAKGRPADMREFHQLVSELRRAIEAAKNAKPNAEPVGMEATRFKW